MYHGWKFDTAGNCVDMPNEPAESDFKHKVKATAYPTQERGGIVWAYMGPRREPPSLPDIEANMLPTSASGVIVNQLTCNWLQALEGDIDTIHAGLLHYGSMRVEDQPPGTYSEYQIKDRTAKFEVIDTEVGASYGARRDGPPGQDYWRMAHFLFRFLTMSPPGVLGPNVSGICYRWTTRTRCRSGCHRHDGPAKPFRPRMARFLGRRSSRTRRGDYQTQRTGMATSSQSPTRAMTF